MAKKPGKGQVVNHSQVSLWVLETDSGPPVVHVLGPRRKSPKSVDADAFRRADGKTILMHKHWWKIVNFTTADIWQIGGDILVPTSFAFPVSDTYFGAYRLDKTPSWGEELVYVSAIIRNRRGKVIGYHADKFGRLSKAKAIQLAKAGEFDNVVVVRNRQGTVFLRTKKNAEAADNLTA